MSWTKPEKIIGAVAIAGVGFIATWGIGVLGGHWSPILPGQTKVDKFLESSEEVSGTFIYPEDQAISVPVIPNTQVSMRLLPIVGQEALDDILSKWGQPGYGQKELDGVLAQWGKSPNHTLMSVSSCNFGHPIRESIDWEAGTLMYMVDDLQGKVGFWFTFWNKETEQVFVGKVYLTAKE